MTAIVGVKYRNGVVLAADSQATGYGGNKRERIDSKIIQSRRIKRERDPELPDEADFWPGILEGMGTITQLTDEYTSPQIEKEYQEALERKRPIGFNPWPEKPKRDPGKRKPF